MILGKPLAAIFLNRNATVTICHSKTENLGFFTRQADLIIMDTGVPGLLTADMVDRKAVVIDAGITKLADGHVVGDVDFETVAPLVTAITPVPGGVGPMTIAAILDTTLELAEKSIEA
jgi:methylenetetrahydrofolate dehydrogenase (NADP+)/methenyltetrahydrofolate cyclohydrolase